VRQIEPVAAGGERVEVVAADPALDLGKLRLDLVRLACGEVEQCARHRAQRRMGRQIRQIGRGRTEMHGGAVGHDRVDREHVLARIAITQRARPARIIADHAADRRARGGGDIDGKPQAVRLEPAVELVEHNAGLDHAALPRHVELDQMVEVFRAVDDKGSIDGLAGLRRAGAARQDAHSLLARERQRVLDFLDRARRHHPDWHDLIVRGIGGVAAARERIELDVTQQLRLEPAFQTRHHRIGHRHVRSCTTPRGLTDSRIRP